MITTPAASINAIKDTHNDTPLSFIPVIVENLSLDALLDTGSDISLISDDLRQSIPSLKRRSLTTSFLLAKSVTGENLDSLGMIPINLQLGSQMIQHNFHVVRNSTRSLVLGWDFILTSHGIIDTTKGLVTLCKENIKLLRPQKHAPAFSNVYVSANITIPAQVHINIIAKLDYPQHSVIPDKYSGIFEPYYSEDSTLILARSVSTFDKGFIVARVLNPFDHPVELKANKYLGKFFSEAEDGEYTLIDQPTDTTSCIPDINAMVNGISVETEGRNNESCSR